MVLKEFQEKNLTNMYAKLFEKALSFVLRWEGGYINHPNDLGGATNMGITQNTYNEWLQSKGRVKKDVRRLTDNEAKQIYYERYWLAAKCNQMSPKFAVLAFDTAVNMGISRVNEFMCAARWLYPDKFIKAREDKYRQFAKVKGQEIFLKGWLNRLNALKEFIKNL